MLSDERIRQMAEDIYYSGGTRAIEYSIRAALAELEAERVPIRCKCCGYLVTESEHRGCLRSAIDGHLLASLRLAAEALHALTDRNITYIGNDAVLPFESNAQAVNHMIDARRHAKEAMEMLAARPDTQP